MHLANNIDIPHGLLGGLILGLSSSAFLVLTGKITGLSGIAEGLVKVGVDDWNWTYMAGLTASGVVLSKLKPDSFGEGAAIAPAVCIAAGVLTGFGTRLSSGCTSGHGLCGLSRRSPRSLVAVLSFMFSGAVTAYLTRSGQISLSFLPDISIPSNSLLMYWGPTAAVLALSVRPTPALKAGSSILTHIAAFASSLAFGLGLGVSGMCSPDRVLGFLDFSNTTVGWDPTLMSVLGAGVTVTFLTFHYFKSAKTPVVLSTSKPPANLGDVLKMGLVKENLLIDWKLVLGSLIFGVGWGLAGMCPGPAVVSMGASVSTAGLFVPSMLLGMKIKEWLV